MQFNLPPKARLAVYVLTGLGGIVVTYLSKTSILGQDEVELWVQLSVLVNGLAAVNVNTNKERDNVI